MADLTMTRGARWAAIGLLLLTLIVGGANLLATYLQVRTVRSAVQAECHFNHDLGGVPITVGPTGKASVLGVEIVADSRLAWRGLGCPGTLPPPSPSFVKWALYYHLPAS